MLPNHARSLAPSRRLWILCLAIVLASQFVPAWAQETPKSQAQTGSASGDQTPSAPAISAPVALYNLLERKSIVFPDIAADSQRLSARQKFELFVDNSVSMHTLTWAALGSSVAEATDSPSGFAQNGDGYAQRFGTSMARQASSNLFGTYLLASALHQDPRFYAENKPGFSRALKYSAERVFITRADDGHNVVNWSGLGGPLLAEGLANLGGGFFQCMPGSGSLTRSAINFQAGAVSRCSVCCGVARSALASAMCTAFARPRRCTWYRFTSSCGMRENARICAA